MIFAFLISLMSCTQDYAVITSGEPEKIYVTETETVTVVEEVEVEVEVPVYIEVEVEGDPGDIWIDSFIQARTVDGIDILWVIDTSGSMHMYDTQLLAGIEIMLAALPDAGWRLVMIPNDPDQAVMESQFPLVPGDDIVDAEAMYSIMRRGPYEEGFDAVYRYVIENPYASTWMRADAGLLVVFLSDEEEQSTAVYPTVPDFTSWYSSLRGGSVWMASIVNLHSSISLCAWPPADRDVGERYMEATNVYAGTITDICADDWSAGVADAAASVVPREKLALSKEAIPESIRVFIDGALNTDWFYHTTDNTVYFTTLPSGVSLVEIGYRYNTTPVDSGI